MAGVEQYFGLELRVGEAHMDPSTQSPEETFWYSLIDYERRVPVPGDLKLDRMRALLRFLGDPHRGLRIVHIAGSKGKGSTAAMLAAVFRQAGYRTGLFTSPHLCRVHERFQVDGQPISSDELRAALRDIQAVSLRHPLSGLTFFEVATAAGFLHFRRRRCEAVVLEVGLGGRFDSTNVCQPAVSVISSISFDHTELLGDRLAKIAAEKAGIVKNGRPCVSGATAPEASAIIEHICRERRAPLRQLDVDFRFCSEPGSVGNKDIRQMCVEVTTAARQWPVLAVNLLGSHQAANAAVAVATVEILRAAGWHLPDAAVAAGLAGVTWPARMEVVGRRPFVVLDCAHNVASAHAAVETLESSFPPGRRSLIFAGSSDKDVAGIFRVLAPHFSNAWLTRYSLNPRAVAPERLAALWHEAGGVGGSAAPAPAEVWHAARAAAGPEDLICVTGSVFLAGELRPLLMSSGTGTEEGDSR
jgi:dihydrofolate synthase / folylpolyglutamate synthase